VRDLQARSKHFVSLLSWKINPVGIRRAIARAETIAIEFVNVYLFVAVLQVAAYKSPGVPGALFWILTPKQHSTPRKKRSVRRSVRFVACCQTSLTCWHSFWQWGQCCGSKLIRLHRCATRGDGSPWSSALNSVPTLWKLKWWFL